MSYCDYILPSFDSMAAFPGIASEYHQYTAFNNFLVDYSWEGGPIAGPSAPRATSSPLVDDHTFDVDDWLDPAMWETATATATSTSPKPGPLVLPEGWDFAPNLPNLLTAELSKSPRSSSSYLCVDSPAPPTEGRSTLKRRRENDTGDEGDDDEHPHKITRHRQSRRKLELKTYPCRWKLAEGGVCNFEGTSQVMWAHMRKTHKVKAKKVPVPEDVRCGWDGCAYSALPEDMAAHWTERHKSAHLERSGLTRALKAARLTCLLCPHADEDEGTGKRKAKANGKKKRLDGLVRHLRTVHWKDYKFCDHCGKEFRSDVFDKPARDHRGDCLLAFMDGSPNC
ncbi:uncharacterized protein C8Q71DRAFT_859428 [Rhodofomes roseus]|uniref:C2H2-type domain-containing protein n=1 Tax=Rhodofomes roseus TaxID=34475 RepID=A0ABQ8KAW6_9APHY|nr:uncharacterized protein C8Q71DRAFT_859428 [Rhodofomes roseus]KAH9834422.1 hypothetical protein C8Q71DRAFT_859428 [Rhodofomes roseus]